MSFLTSLRRVTQHPVLEDLLGIDPRSLASFRIGLAVILLADLMGRARALTAHYTDDGVLPRGVLTRYFPDSWFPCVHLLGGSTLFEAGLFAIAALLALGLLLGWRTPWVTVASWALFASLQTRNPLVNSGDLALRLFLFWSMWLPLGACYSLDRAFSLAAAPLPRRVLSCATVGILFQFLFIYWFSALSRTEAAWHAEGTAIYYVLSSSEYPTALGKYLLHYPALLVLMTHGTMCMETLGTALVFVPVAMAPLRTVLVLSFIAFHTGLGLCLDLGVFSHLCCVAWLLFLPSWFWDHAARGAATLKQKYGSPPQSSPAGPVGTVPPGVSSTVGRTTPVVQGLAAFFLVYILLWNLRNYDAAGLGRVLPTGLNWIAEMTRTDQRWNIFANVSHVDGWYVIPTSLADGTRVDLFKDGAPVNWQRPPLISATLKSHEWLKYLRSIRQPSLRPLVFYYARYLAREWNRRHLPRQRVQAMAIYFMRERHFLDKRTQPLAPLLLFSSYPSSPSHSTAPQPGTLRTGPTPAALPPAVPSNPKFGGSQGVVPE